MKIITISKLLLLATALITQNVFSAPNVTTNLDVISGPNFKIKRGLVVAIGGFRNAERQRIDFVESLGLDMVTLAQNLCDFTNEFEKPLHQFYENNEGTVSVRVDPDVIKVRQYAAAKNLRVVHQISGVPYRCIFINKEWDTPILPILEQRQWTGNANWYPVADHNYRGTIGGIIGRWAQAVEAADGSFSSIWAGTQEPSHTVGFPAGPDGNLIRTPEQVSNNVNLYFHSWKRTAKLLNEVGIETGGLQLNEADTAYFDQTLKNFRDTNTPLDYFTAQNYAAGRGVGDYLKAAKTALQNNGYPWEKKVLFNRYSLKKPDNWEVNSAGIIHWLKAEKQIINNADILYGYSLEYSKAANSVLLSETLRFVHDMIGVRRPLNSTIDGLNGFIGANKQRFTAVIWNSSGTNQNLELKIQNMPENYSNLQLKTTLVKAESQSEIEGTFNKANGIVQIDGIPDKGYLLIEISHAPAEPNLAAGRPVQVSSTESDDNIAANAVDGLGHTRWSSQYGDPQWVYVDLGQTYEVNRVRLNWEAAYGTAYQIQVSDNASTWTTIYTTSSGDGGLDDLSGLNGNGRYVRMYGTSRATQWGYSLWEFEVYGTAAGSNAVTLDQHCDYSGWSASLGEGSHNTIALQSAGAIDNDASSISVQPGYEVTLYTGDAFTGTAITVNTDISCLVDYGINDAVSSMVVSLNSSSSSGSSSSSSSSSSGGSCNGLPSWNSSSVYVAEDRVQHQSTQYRAKWWTQGDDPSESGEWDVWANEGSCP